VPSMRRRTVFAQCPETIGITTVSGREWLSVVASGNPFGARIGAHGGARNARLGGLIRAWVGPLRSLESFAVSPMLGGAGKAFGTMRDYTEFGLLLRQARDARKVHQVHVARKAGVSASFLRRVERGVALPSLLLFAALWRLLGFDANALLDALGVRSRAVPGRLSARKATSTRARVTSGRFVEFGILVARTRVSADLTQEALAFALGVGVRFLARIEAGVQLPSVLLVAKMRHAIGVDGNALLAALLDESPREPFHALGRILEVARERCGLGRVDVARAARCGSEVYERAESGHELPTVRELARMHRVLRFNGNAALRAVCLADSQDSPESQGKGVV
jgi:transcriptional regulator with XRE-family HTH domain